MLTLSSLATAFEIAHAIQLRNTTADARRAAEVRHRSREREAAHEQERLDFLTEQLIRQSKR